MKFSRALVGGVAIVMLSTSTISGAGVVTAVTESAACSAGQKLGRSATDAAQHSLARTPGDEVSLASKSGSAGDAVSRTSKLVRLHEVAGDQALWVTADARRLAIFTKYGESATLAMYKHPGIAEELIEQFGDDAIAILQNSSRRNAQRFAMLADDGLLAASGRSGELLRVIRRFGDPAMEFVWKNKGALAVSSVLATFLMNPHAYITGVATLLAPAIKEVNWTLAVLVILGFVLLPRIVPSFLRGMRNARERKGAYV
jgi:hypothetical protein